MKNRFQKYAAFRKARLEILHAERSAVRLSPASDRQAHSPVRKNVFRIRCIFPAWYRYVFQSLAKAGLLPILALFPSRQKAYRYRQWTYQIFRNSRSLAFYIQQILYLPIGTARSGFALPLPPFFRGGYLIPFQIPSAANQAAGSYSAYPPRFSPSLFQGW